MLNANFTADNFAARFAQVKLATKNDIAAFAKETDFDNEMKNINKKVTNKAKHVDVEKKLTDLTKKVAQLSEKGYDFLLGRMYFTANDGYQKLVFAPMLNSLTLDKNKRLLTGYRPEYHLKKNKLFDTNLELILSNLANGRVV